MEQNSNIIKKILSPEKLFIILIFIVALIGLYGKHQLYGDSREYIIQTQSIVKNHSLIIDTKKTADYWNSTNPYGLKLFETNPPSPVLNEQAQAWGNFGGLYPDRTGNYRYYHFWLYSIVVSPFYFLFSILKISPSFEYYSFRFVNTLLLLAVYYLLWYKKPNYYMLSILILLLFTPILAYCDWHHPEIFCLFLIIISLKGIHIKKLRYFSPAFLGAAATLYPPIIFFAPYHFYLNIKVDYPARKKEWIKFLSVYILLVIIAVSSMLYFYFYFRTPNVISYIGLAMFKYASVSRLLSMFFSPLVGIIIFYHLCFFILPGCISSDRVKSFIMCILSVTAAAYLCTTTKNFNSGQVGAVRYSIWLVAPLLYLISECCPDKNTPVVKRKIFFSGAIVSCIFVLYFKLYMLSVKDISYFSGISRAQKETARLYRFLPIMDDVETLTENIMGMELNQPSDFNSVYVWDIGRGKTIWVISERAVENLSGMIIEMKDNSILTVSAYPAQTINTEINENKIHLSLSSPPMYYIHSVYGKYFVMRMNGRIDTIYLRNNEKIKIRSNRISIKP